TPLGASSLLRLGPGRSLLPSDNRTSWAPGMSPFRGRASTAQFARAPTHRLGVAASGARLASGLPACGFDRAGFAPAGPLLCISRVSPSPPFLQTNISWSHPVPASGVRPRVPARRAPGHGEDRRAGERGRGFGRQAPFTEGRRSQGLLGLAGG